MDLNLHNQNCGEAGGRGDEGACRRDAKLPKDLVYFVFEKRLLKNILKKMGRVGLSQNSVN